MITREGMETALLIATAFFQLKSAAVLVGPRARPPRRRRDRHAVDAAGQGRGPEGDPERLGGLPRDLPVQLILYGVHELAEARLFPSSQAIHDATEILGPDGVIGHLLAYALAVIPTVWLAAPLVEAPPRGAPEDAAARINAA